MCRRVFITVSVLSIFSVCSVNADVVLYSGKIEIVSTSGGSCAGIAKIHDVSMVIEQKSKPAEISGYFEGDGVNMAVFSGATLSRLAVRYPFKDNRRAEGHLLSIARGKGGALQAELRDRHIEQHETDCNFDLARMSLVPVTGNEGAVARLRRMRDYFEAQLAREEANAFARAGRFEAALPYYEKALALAESAKANSPALLSSYVAGLANAYLRLGATEEFDRLYDRRISSVTDASMKTLFTAYRVRSLIRQGKTALKREEFAEALDHFQKAYQLQTDNKEAIAAVMTVYIKTNRHDEAIAFLEDSIRGIDNQEERKDLSRAVSQIYYMRSMKYNRSGKGAEAEADLKQAIALDSGTALYHVALARLRHKLGSLAEAESLLDLALEHLKDDASRSEITSARERIRQTDLILARLKAGG